MRGHKELIEESKNTPGYIVYKWVCIFHQRSGANKILRNVVPTYVAVCFNHDYFRLEELYKLEKISSYELHESYYCDIFIVKNGKITKKEISFYGNTTDDDGLYYFDNEEECVKTYNELIYQSIKEIENERTRTISKFDSSINNLKNMFIKTDYVMETLSH